MEHQSSGLVSSKVHTLTDQTASSMLSNLDLDTDLLEKFLPTVTKCHKPFTKSHPFPDLTPPDLSKILQNWLDWIKSFTTIEISKLLNLVTSVKGIYNIREESLSVELPENYEKICTDLSLPLTNFWSDFYQNLLTKRVKEIVSEKWSESLKMFKKNIADLLTKVNNEKYEFPENDLRWFVWKDSPGDIPQKLSKTISFDGKRSLLMKARGYSPNLVNLCQEFDKNLNNLLQDLEQYLYESERVQSVKENLLSMNLSSIFDKFTDRSEIQENLQNVSAEMIAELVRFVRDEYTGDKPNLGRREVNAIVLARFLQALTTLCPSLNKCFTLSKISGFVSTNVKWQSICDRIRDESIEIWAVWAGSYKRKVKEHRDGFLSNESFDKYSVGSVVSEWERVIIEEEAEEGKRIKSEILVPYQSSVNLQKFLACVTRDLNKIIPHTVPK